MYKYILFDLDGTLLNTYEGVKNCAACALTALGEPIPDEATMRRYLGPPLIDSFTTIAGLSVEKAEEAIRIFRKRYREIGIYEYSLYEDLAPVFRKLRENGYILAVATSKLENMARKVLEHAGLAEYFTYIGGSIEEKGINTKSAVISYVIEALGADDKSEILMVGDREHDIYGAHENGIKAVGVLCGFGSSEEFASCGADYVIENVSDITDILCE